MIRARWSHISHSIVLEDNTAALALANDGKKTVRSAVLVVTTFTLSSYQDVLRSL
jgi:hypothetical protein